MHRYLLITASLLAMEGAVQSADEAPALAKQNRWVTSAAFISAGSQLVTGGGESLLYRAGDVKIWDVKSGAQVANLEGQPTIVWSLAASADGKTLITSGYDGKIIIWNVAEKKPQQTIEKKGWIRRVALSPDGATLATSSTDKLAKLWDWKAEMPTEKAKLEGHGDAVWAVAWSKDGSLATAGAD